jgi:hypothetical protein
MANDVPSFVGIIEKAPEYNSLIMASSEYPAFLRVLELVNLTWWQTCTPFEVRTIDLFI